MSSWDTTKLMAGDWFGTHDVGFTAWNIRWKSAGWANRDNMVVCVHCGLLYDSNPGLIRGAEMDRANNDEFDIIDMSVKYINRAGDNPGVTLFLRSYCLRTLDWVRAYFQSTCLSLHNHPAKYDVAAVVGSYFGVGKLFNNDAKMICTELTWNLITGCERIAGFRMTYAGTPLYPTQVYNLKRLGWSETQAWANSQAFVMWNTCGPLYSWDTPYGQQVRYSSRTNILWRYQVIV